jgi:hypothetical protein
VHLNDLHCFSIAQNTWRTIVKKGAPTPRSHHTTNNINDRLVVFGGNTKVGTGCCNDLHVFDTDTEQWAQPSCEGAIPAARWGHTANVVADTKLVVMGGWNGTWLLGDTLLFDCETLTWSKLSIAGRAPAARAHHSCTLVGTRLYVFGGRSGGTRHADVNVLCLIPDADDKHLAALKVRVTGLWVLQVGRRNAHGGFYQCASLAVIARVHVGSISFRLCT